MRVLSFFLLLLITILTGCIQSEKQEEEQNKTYFLLEQLNNTISLFSNQTNSQDKAEEDMEKGLKETLSDLVLTGTINAKITGSCQNQLSGPGTSIIAQQETTEQINELIFNLYLWKKHCSGKICTYEGELEVEYVKSICLLINGTEDMYAECGHAMHSEFRHDWSCEAIGPVDTSFSIVLETDGEKILKIERICCGGINTDYTKMNRKHVEFLCPATATMDYTCVLPPCYSAGEAGCSCAYCLNIEDEFLKLMLEGTKLDGKTNVHKTLTPPYGLSKMLKMTIGQRKAKITGTVELEVIK